MRGSEVIIEPENAIKSKLITVDILANFYSVRSYAATCSDGNKRVCNLIYNM